MKTLTGAKSPSVDSGKPRRILPSFTLTTKDLPQIKDWKVGGAYYLKVKVEQTQLGKGEDTWSDTEKGDKTMHARFQVLALEAIDKKENYEDEYSRKRSNSPRS